MAIKLSSLTKAGKSLAKKSTKVGGFKVGGYRRRHKKSASWYAREIQRIRLKRKYEKLKFGIGGR